MTVVLIVDTEIAWYVMILDNSCDGLYKGESFFS